MPAIKIKRAYDKVSKADGYRILVDRLWPRGLKKEEASIDEWAKELAPSTELRNWFDHDPFRWDEFRKRYNAELQENNAVEDFIERHRNRKHITLIYATRYDKLTHALVLQKLLDKNYRAS